MVDQVRRVVVLMAAAKGVGLGFVTGVVVAHVISPFGRLCGLIRYGTVVP